MKPRSVELGDKQKVKNHLQPLQNAPNFTYSIIWTLVGIHKREALTRESRVIFIENLARFRI